MRIGIEDRIFLNVLGSLVIPMTVFAVTQIILLLIRPFESKFHMLRRLRRYLSFEGPLRPVLILFFIETYLDLFIGGLINTENGYLFDVPANWGWNGLLTYSDQFTVLLGYVFYILCLLFPFVVIWVLHKHSKVSFLNKADEQEFDSLYNILYEDFKKNDNPFVFYYLVYIVRRALEDS